LTGVSDWARFGALVLEEEEEDEAAADAAAADADAEEAEEASAPSFVRFFAVPFLAEEEEEEDILEGSSQLNMLFTLYGYLCVFLVVAAPG
jgi:hypothetical protein